MTYTESPETGTDILPPYIALLTEVEGQVKDGRRKPARPTIAEHQATIRRYRLSQWVFLAGGFLLGALAEAAIRSL